MPNKVKCCEKLYADFHYYPCARNATTEHEGKPYCKTHNPALRQAKQDASTQAWKAEMAAKTEKRTADAHKIAVHDDLVSALQDVAQTLLWVQYGECRGFNTNNLLSVNDALGKARTTLALAKKD